ncbi:MalY/PatB family protein [Erysipelothrix urinaevulpis]|uniref:MalY/PatB family protein n=1 Tax=Erysipelothrix urinaevulpis TaxID=2683717 RepID=UPI00135BCC04|nr:aminotransferase class I/II-fold pyridoxal phosphate-dependent enzyme [Erysipelothrix urinaevulpis]
MTQKVSTLNRENNGSKKWNRNYIEKRFNIQEKQKIYPLFIADMDFRHSDKIIKQLEKVVLDDDFGYFDVCESYYHSICRWQKKVHHIELKEEWIIPANGTIAALHMAASALAVNDNFLIMTPVYGVFKTIGLSFGKLYDYALKEVKGRYSFDLKEIEQAIITQNINTLIFCNPHNPSGRMWTKDELKSLVGVCKKHKVKIFSDEIHGDLILTDEKFVSLIEFNDIYSDILVSTSPNKSFNLSGLTTSYLLTNNSTWKNLIEQEMLKYHISMNRMGIEASRIVYDYGQEWFSDVLVVIKENILIVEEMCRDTDLGFMAPDAGYLLWIKLDKVKDIDRYIQDLSFKTGVLLETGSRFIGNYNQYIRINVATDRNLLIEAMTLFKNHYENYEGDSNEN